MVHEMMHQLIIMNPFLCPPHLSYYYYSNLFTTAFSRISKLTFPSSPPSSSPFPLTHSNSSHNRELLSRLHKENSHLWDVVLPISTPFPPPPLPLSQLSFHGLWDFLVAPFGSMNPTIQILLRRIILIDKLVLEALMNMLRRSVQ